MMSEREYLVTLGLAKPGRGRFSREGKAALAKARADGMTFKGGSPVSARPTIIKNSPEGTTVVDATESGYGEAFLRYGRMDMQFEGFDSNGKRHVVSGRNTCSCGYSLVGHTCEDASALIGGGERIKVRPIV